MSTPPSALIRRPVKLAAFCIMFSLAACSEKPDAPLVLEIGSQHGAMKFRIPPEYGAVSEHGRSIALQAGYPSMRPAAGKLPEDKAINVVLRAVHGATEGEEILSLIGMAAGTQSFKADGNHGAVPRYKRDLPVSDPRSGSTYYIFRSGDGQVVLFIDDGSWAQSLRLYRRIGANAMLSATLPKPHAERLIEADATLMQFVRSITVKE